MVISGTELARQLHREIQRDVEELVAQGNMRPHLGVVLVGDDPASRTYVRNKTRAASILGQPWAFTAFLNTACIMSIMQISDDNTDQIHAFHIFRQIHVDAYVDMFVSQNLNEWTVKNVNQHGNIHCGDVYALSRYFQWHSGAAELSLPGGIAGTDW